MRSNVVKATSHSIICCPFWNAMIIMNSLLLLCCCSLCLAESGKSSEVGSQVRFRGRLSGSAHDARSVWCLPAQEGHKGKYQRLMYDISDAKCHSPCPSTAHFYIQRFLLLGPLFYIGRQSKKVVNSRTLSAQKCIKETVNFKLTVCRSSFSASSYTHLHLWSCCLFQSQFDLLFATPGDGTSCHQY